MIVGLIDFETQDIDAKTTHATEVGMLIAEVDPSDSGASWPVVTQYGALIYEPDYPPQSEEVVALTGITDDLLKQKGLPRAQVVGELRRLVSSCEVVIAHNAQFDRTVYETLCEREGVQAEQPSNGWLCSVTDINWAKKYKCKKLSHLAYDHGILVHPDTLHRAVDDVALLGRLLSLYRLDELLAYRDTPWVTLKATVPAPWEDGGVGNRQVKALNYGWEKVFGTDDVYPKSWVKRVKETELASEKAKAPFPIHRIVKN